MVPSYANALELSFLLHLDSERWYTLQIQNFSRVRETSITKC